MKLTTPKLIATCSAMACLLASLTTGLRAQSTPPPPTTTTTTTTTSTTAPAGSDDVTTLAKYTVSDVPLQDQVLPTVRPVGDVMGEDMNILDIPRSVSAVNAAMMRDRQVTNAMDFDQFAPGVYSAAEYGIPAIPFIRGDLAQLYVMS